MRSIQCLVWMCMTISLVGCSSFNKKLASAKPKNTNTTVGSAEFSSSNRLKNPAKTHLAYGAWHEQTGNYSEARKSYSQVLEKNPKELEAILGLARIDQTYERFAECDQHLAKALKYYPKDPKVQVAMGHVHAARGEWPEALERMKAAQKLAPVDPIYEYHLAVIEAQAGELKPAFDHFTRSVGQAEANYNIGYILYEQGRTSEAETYLKKALQLKPELKQAENTLAEIRAANASDVQPVSFSDRTQTN